MGLLGLCSCGSPSSVCGKYFIDEIPQYWKQNAEENNEVLVYESSMELKYAENFSVDYYVEDTNF